MEKLTGKNAASIIRLAAERDRKNYEDMKAKFDRFSHEFWAFKDAFDMMLPFDQFGFPEWPKNVPYNLTDAPIFMSCPQAPSVYDYFYYMSKTFPYIQSVLREFHSYVTQLGMMVEQKVDRGEFDVFIAKTNESLDQMMEEVSDYVSKKGSFVMRSDFEDLAEELHRIVDIAANAAITNTKCLACGKKVERVAGSQSSRSSSRAAPMSARGQPTRNLDLLRLDGLHGGDVVRGHTAKGQRLS
jgi:hypothetical protein